MKNMDSVRKIDVLAKHWDRLFAPSSCLVMITTVDKGDQRGVLRYLRAGLPRSRLYCFYGRGHERHLS